MKRWLVLLFALLLPVQVAWGAAASYCQHEQDLGTAHFGHHEHVHKTCAEQPADSKAAGDNDCGTCHAAGPALPFEASPCTTVAPSSAAVVSHLLRPFPTALARAPDRPQWLRLA